MPARHILTLTCHDRPGIVHAVTGAVLELEGNIVENSQFTDPTTNTFCMRTAIDAPEASAAALAAAADRRLDDQTALLKVRPEHHRPRILIMVSRLDHCLVDLLYRWRSGLLPVEIAAVASNHDDCADVARSYGVAFHHLPIDSAIEKTAAKQAQEARVLSLLDQHQIDLVVLARYMQILSSDLCTHLQGRAINIHHSFLPGFKGAKPYHQAYARGVKLVGATAHFVTSDLDEGPIIEQDIARVTHAHTPEQLVELGQDTERVVLSRAVRAWAEDRVFLVGDKTVVLW